jgi:hypothetical protein
VSGADHDRRELDDMMMKTSPLVYLLVAILHTTTLDLLLPFRLFRYYFLNRIDCLIAP